jgi:hypothetical protein
VLTDTGPNSRAYATTASTAATSRFSACTRLYALHEQTGLAVDPGALGWVIAYITGATNFGWTTGRFGDDFFFYQTGHHEVDVVGMESGSEPLQPVR